MNKLAIFPLILLLGCASGMKKEILETSSDKPRWVSSSKTVWEEDDKVLIKSVHTVKGDERKSACYDLARLDAKEMLLSEIKADVKGRIDNAIQGISENSEEILGKVRSVDIEGSINGLRFAEQYDERYVINKGTAVERIDCFTKAEIRKNDYNDLKNRVINKIVAMDPRIKEAITKGQVDFFTNKKDDDSRKPASADTPHAVNK